MIAVLGPFEVGVAFLVVLLLFGGKRLPDLARSIGTGAREFRRGLADDPSPEDSD